MKANTFSPRSLLKARRPERFSDTSISEAIDLDRSILEFHLDTVTSRNQEADFERFARLICEREICPNLLPHTGPTGGGDSKVDSETYPVAENLTFAWHSGWGQEAAQERWAFAFSAKKDWRTKLGSDVIKIVGTQRGYTKAFFVTNQSVPDRKRAEVEDTLKAKYGIEIHVFDRTWILDRVFTNKHQGLVARELKIASIVSQEIIKGPNDAQRETELGAIEKRIQETIQGEQFTPALVDAAIHAADLTRNLELPRVDIEGRYNRADRLSLKCGTHRQQVEVAYQWAWTLFWWFEDYSAFTEQYSLVESRASGSEKVFDLDRLFTLWNNLHGCVTHGVLDREAVSYEQHTNKLLTELARLRTEKDRPSTALQAETFYLQVQLAQRWAAQEPVGDTLRSLKDVILRSENLVGYPLKSFTELLEGLGDIFEDETAYNELFDTIIEVISKRDGEVSAAKLLLKRGEQQFNHDRPVEAIGTLGRALVRLYKHETRHLMVKALYYCGCAYEQIGLLWAARGTLLAASSIATNELWQYGKVTLLQAACYRRLKRIEMRLGRLPHILAWQELDIAISKMLVAQGYDLETLFSEEVPFDTLVGRLLLRTDFFDLRALEKIPDILDEIGLELASSALLFALGHTQRMEEVAKEFDTTADVFASEWRSIEADVLLADKPILYNQSKIFLESRVLGCKIIIESPMDSPCVEVAESILAAIESFFATGFLHHAIAIEPELTIEVRTTEFAQVMIDVGLEERAGRPHLVVKCKHFDPHNISVDDQQILKENIFQVVIKVSSSVMIFKDIEHDLEMLFRDERVLDRAVAFTGTFGAQSNVLGALPKTRLKSWVNEEAQSYTLLRTEPWKPLEIKRESSKDQQIDSDSQNSKDAVEDPNKLFDPNSQSHDQIETISLIRGMLWDRARWSGILFTSYIDIEYPPFFTFIFKDPTAGREIFKQWLNEFGKIDEQEQIRVVVIKGIDKAHPHAYRVIVGSNSSAMSEGKLANMVHRSHRMDAETSDNLERFISAHATVDALYLAPAIGEVLDQGKIPEIDFDLRILIHKIYVRNAWEIGPNDIDMVGIHPNTDDPIIPDGLEKAPVLELLRKSKRQ